MLIKIINIPRGTKKVVGLKLRKTNRVLRNFGTKIICPFCGIKSQSKIFISGGLNKVKLSS